MRISDITAQRKSETRVNVFLDGTYWVSLDIVQVVELGLKVGKDITPQQKAAIEYESGFGKAYAAALNLISIRMRSKKEITDYAWRKKWEDDVTSRVVERLENKGLLNDERFARSWVGERSRLKPQSKRKIQVELQQKGIKGEEAQNALSGYNEQEALRSIIIKKQNRYPETDKLIQYLMRQGFAYGDIKEVLAANNENVD